MSKELTKLSQELSMSRSFSDKWQYRRRFCEQMVNFVKTSCIGVQKEVSYYCVTCFYGNTVEASLVEIAAVIDTNELTDEQMANINSILALAK